MLKTEITVKIFIEHTIGKAASSLGYGLFQSVAMTSETVCGAIWRTKKQTDASKKCPKCQKQILVSQEMPQVLTVKKISPSIYKELICEMETIN